MKQVEILYFEGCPHAQAAIGLVEEIVDQLGVDASVRPVLVEEGKIPPGFRGSPTVLVDGADIEPGPAPVTGSLSCRVYAGGGLPPRERLEAALQGAP